MEFQFAPWERLTSDVVDGKADLCVAIAGCRWLVRQCGALQWVRPFGRPTREWNYLLRPRDEMLPSRLVEETPIAEVLADRNSRELALCRCWQLARESWAFWSAGAEFKFARSLNDFTSRESPFYFELGSSVAVGNARSSTVFEQLKRDWKNPNSSLALTARYLELPATQQELYAVTTRTETPREFVVLVRHLLRVFPRNHFSLTNELNVTFSTNQDSQGHYSPRTLAHLNSNGRAILRHVLLVFAPQMRPELAALPIPMIPGGTWFTVRAQVPSMHEQLEAALELRAWLQGHWPDGLKHLGKIV